MDHKAIMQGVMVRIAVSVFGLATLAMLLLALYNDKGYFAVHAQSLKLKALQSDIQSLETDIDSIKEENKLLNQSDPEVIERHGREDLGLVKPGDRIIHLSDGPASSSLPADSNGNNGNDR